MTQTPKQWLLKVVSPLRNGTPASSYDFAYLQETHPEWSGVSEEACRAAWQDDQAVLSPKSPREHLAALGLDLASYPETFPWQLYARLVPASGAHRWAALDHYCNHGFASGIRLPFNGDGKAFLVALARRYAARNDRLAIGAFELAAVAAPLTPGEKQHLADSYLRERLWRPARNIYQDLIRDSRSADGNTTAWTVRNCVLASLSLNDWDNAAETLATSRGAMGEDPVWRLSSNDLLEQSFAAGLQAARARYAAGDAASGDATIETTVSRTCDILRRLEAPHPFTRGSREVVMIANCDDPGGRRLRVGSKDALFTSIGRPWRMIPMGELAGVHGAPSNASAIIFFNVPATLEPLRTVLAARAAGIPTVFEADGPVFDPSCLPPPLASYDGFLAPSLHDELRLACALYRALATRCDIGIAAASLTAAKLATLVERSAAFVVSNGLASGSDIDHPAGSAPGRGAPRALFLRSMRFLSVTTKPGSLGAALIEALRSDPSLRLVTSGYVRLAEAFNDHDAQIDDLGHEESAAEIETALGSALLNIAPEAACDDDGFADLSWLEAANHGVTTVIGRHIANALGLVDAQTCIMVDEGGWTRALATCLCDPQRLAAIGDHARVHASSTRSSSARADQLSRVLAAADDLASRGAGS